MRRLPSLLLAGLLLSGCVSGPGVKTHLDPVTVARIAGEAVRLGSATTLAIHPEFRPQFLQARQAVGVLLAIGNFDINQLTALLSSLPIGEGDQGQIGIIIGAGFATIWGIYGEYVMTLDKTSSFPIWVKPIAVAIAAGLDQALGQPSRPLHQLPR